MTIGFTPTTATTLHFAGAADCTICCNHPNGSAVQLRAENASAPGGYSWIRSGLPAVSGTQVTAVVVPATADTVVSTELLRFMYEV